MQEEAIFVPVEKFGIDHWTTFLYLETLIVDHGGVLKDTDPRMRVTKHNAKNYPTRLNDGSLLDEHDDWDCLDDLTVAGLIVADPADNRISLTDKGWAVVSQLRRYKAEKNGIRNFKMQSGAS